MIPQTISQALCQIDNEEKMSDFLDEILTEAEKKSVYARWELMLRLKNGETHRKIASDLKMSLCKITRGNKILKNKDSVTNALFGERNEQKG